MISIREVAELAGVSAATVSRVMNGTAKVDPAKKNGYFVSLKKQVLFPAQHTSANGGVRL